MDITDFTIKEIRQKKTECCDVKPIVVVICPGCNHTTEVSNVVHSQMPEVLQDQSGPDKE